MSFKLRLNILVTALMILLSFVAMGMLMHNARIQVAAEVESTSTLVNHLLNTNLQLVDNIKNTNQMKSPFLLEGFEHLRHLRVEFFDTKGKLKYSSLNKSKVSYSNTPPEWFSIAVTKALERPVQVKRSIVVDNRYLGELVVSPDPSYEVQEVWNDTFDFFVLFATFFFVVNIILYWAVGKALKPVDAIVGALTALENGNLGARLPQFELPELTSISDKFNLMAGALEKSIANNHQLSSQLIQLQEEERKLIARDLHDELGQYLIAIRTEANTLLEMSKAKPQYSEAKESAQAILDSSVELMTIVRHMLQRLRPDVLDKLGLRPAILEVVTMWRERYPSIALISKIPSTFPEMRENLNITAYRVVQECLTNVAKHANARRVEIEIKEIEDYLDARQFFIRIYDDGHGFNPNHTNGLGLRGMRERIEGMGGKLIVQSAVGHGTTIATFLPVGQEVNASFNQS